MGNSITEIREIFKNEVEECISLLNESINSFQLFERYKGSINTIFGKKMVAKAYISKARAERLIKSFEKLFLNDNSSLDQLLDQLEEKNNNELAAERFKKEGVEKLNTWSSTNTFEGVPTINVNLPKEPSIPDQGGVPLKWVLLIFLATVLSFVGLYTMTKYIINKIRHLPKSNQFW